MSRSTFSILCAAALASCGHGARPRWIMPVGDLRCLAVRPDTGFAPFVPGQVILGTNRLGALEWRAAAVKPAPRLEPAWQERYRMAGGKWQPYYQGDSIQIEWGGTVFGPEGLLILEANGDTVHGRAAPGGDVVPIGPWVPITAHVSICAPGD